MKQDNGASLSATGLSQAEPKVSALLASIPSATAPLQPAGSFIAAMADRLQEAHRPPLERDRAVAMAVRVLTEAEADCAPFNHSDFDWSLDGAATLADLEIEHWERVDGSDD